MPELGTQDSSALQITVPISSEFAEILTPAALQFLEKLHRHFSERRLELLGQRQERQAAVNRGEMLRFLEHTRSIRDGDWNVAPLPNDLLDRRVEITGPSSDRKMVINALNSGAKIFMADFEDANSPTWENTIVGQINLRDALNRTISFTNFDGKKYTLNDEVATLLVRPRGWHLKEKHVLVEGQAMSGSLFDFGLYFFHNVKTLLAMESGPYFYLPKLESHLEARLWNDVFTFAEAELNVAHGTIKATVLIETIWATFEMDEILYELRDHAAGLNCGRWDYIFSYLKTFRNHPDIILPDRAQVTMLTPFMRKYSQLTIKTCHKRKAMAIGGMAAQIPIKNNPAANDEAFAKVRADKVREAKDGHDGTWVAHPGLVPVAKEVFDQLMPEANQMNRLREDVNIMAEELVEVPDGTITEEGLRTNVRVGVQYIEAWLRGSGAVPLYNLMEDAATAEISRAQVWQWIRHQKGILVDGRKVTVELFEDILEDELNLLRDQIGTDAYQNRAFANASELFRQLILQDQFSNFLTEPGYEQLN